MIGFAVITIILSYILTNHSFTVAYNPIFLDERNFSMALMESNYIQALNVFKSYIFTGIGLGNFKSVSQAFELAPWQVFTTTGSEFIWMFSATGIIGGLIFLFFIYKAFRMSLNLLTTKDTRSTQSFEVGLALFVFILFMLFYPVMHVIELTFLFFVILAIGVRILNIDRFFNNSGNIFSYSVSVISLLSLILSIYFFVGYQMFQGILNSLVNQSQTQSIAPQVQSIESLIRFNPIDAYYPYFLVQVGLSSSSQGTNSTPPLSMSQLVSYNASAMKLDSQSLYIRLSNNQILYFQGQMSKAEGDMNDILKRYKYADPQIYLYAAQLYSSDTTKETSYLTMGKNIFVVNNDYTVGKSFYQNLGMSRSLTELLIQYGLNTKDYSVIKTINSL